MSRETGTARKMHVQFASDNYSGICPEAWAMMQEATAGHALSYGDDEWTDRACNLLRELFETDCEVFFALTGTAANALALASLCQSYHSVLCHRAAHVETDECGAPEFFSNGTKILLVPGEDGKIDLDAVEKMVNVRTDIHYPKPRVSASHSPRSGHRLFGGRVHAAGELAHRLGLRVHMDGGAFRERAGVAEGDAQGDLLAGRRGCPLPGWRQEWPSHR